MYVEYRNNPLDRRQRVGENKGGGKLGAARNEEEEEEWEEGDDKAEKTKARECQGADPDADPGRAGRFLCYGYEGDGFFGCFYHIMILPHAARDNSAGASTSVSVFFFLLCFTSWCKYPSYY